jgi:hypothetical protein
MTAVGLQESTFGAYFRKGIMIWGERDTHQVGFLPVL